MSLSTDTASPLSGALRPSDVAAKDESTQESPVIGADNEDTEEEPIVVSQKKARSASMTELTMAERQAFWLEKKAAKVEAVKAAKLKEEEEANSNKPKLVSNYKMAQPRKSLAEQSADRSNMMKAAAVAAEKVDSSNKNKKKKGPLRKSSSSVGDGAGAGAGGILTRRNTWDGAIGAVLAANKMKKKKTKASTKLPKIGSGAPKSSAERKQGGKLDEELAKLKAMKAAAENAAAGHEKEQQEKIQAVQDAQDMEQAAVLIQGHARKHSVIKQINDDKRVKAEAEAEAKRVADELASREYVLEGTAFLFSLSLKDTHRPH
jgi:hypothetical protein